MRILIILFINLFLPIFLISQATAAPKVVVSILPLHALADGVLDGVSKPKLLVKGGQSPHSYSLRPSDAKALAEAELVVWVGPELESFLATPLTNLAPAARKLELLREGDLFMLPQRSGGAWETNDHHETEEDHLGSNNPHLWLDPQNAQLITRLLADTLSELDPANKETYQNNAHALQQRLKQLDQDLSRQLKPLGNLPYLVFHDAYPYFEQRYKLHPLGAIAVSPDKRPGAKRISAIRTMIEESKARCVFAEPQFKPQMVETLISGTTAKSGILDPLGSDLTPGLESYFKLLHRMADNIEHCLQSSP